MKSLLRSVLVFAFALFVLPQVLSGLTITGGIPTYIFGGVTLTLMQLLLSPILNIISFPFNFVTLGLFSVLTNMLILYLLTVFVPNIQIKAFTYPGFSMAGFTIPEVYLSQFFAFLVVSLLLSVIVSGLSWIMK